MLLMLLLSHICVFCPHSDICLPRLKDGRGTKAALADVIIVNTKVYIYRKNDTIEKIVRTFISYDLVLVKHMLGNVRFSS
jgi:hypothetical protein